MCCSETDFALFSAKISLQTPKSQNLRDLNRMRTVIYNEMRELMKDMKAQADLFAAKVRDLVASLTRDILGILVFIGFSFIGKFDLKDLESLLLSNALSLVVKF